MRYASSNFLRLVLLAGLLAGFLDATEPETEYRWRILPTIGDTVNLTLTRKVGLSSNSNVNTVPLGSLRGLERSDLLGGAVTFRIRRDAGTLQCKGAFTLGVGWGSVSFEPDPQFGRELKEIGLGAVRDDQLFDLAMDNLRISTARELRAACKCVETIDDVVQLNNHGVDGRYLREATQLWPQPISVEEVTEMKDHGVQISSLEALRSGGYRLPVKAVIELQDHGVDPSFVREMSPQLKDASDAHDLIALHDHGVSAEFVRHIRESGANPSTAEIIELHEHGTDPALVRSARDAGLGEPVSVVIALHDHGVDQQYVRTMSKALRPKVTANDLIELHDHGVAPEFAQRVAESGFEARTPESLISLHEHGVPVELLTQAVHSHHVSFAIGEIIRLHENGIDGDFMRSFDAAGYANASAADLIELHNHGVTADYARRMQSEGFGTLSISQLIKMKDHGL